MFTVIISNSDGTMLLDTVADARTPAAAVDAFCAQKGVDSATVKDAIVLLGITGSTMLHRSVGMAKKHSEPTQAELEAAFRRVRNAESWKLPVRADLPGQLSPEEERLISEACAHFGAGPAEFRYMPRKKVTRVSAPGYYVTIGA